MSYALYKKILSNVPLNHLESFQWCFFVWLMMWLYFTILTALYMTPPHNTTSSLPCTWPHIMSDLKIHVLPLICKPIQDHLASHSPSPSLLTLHTEPRHKLNSFYHPKVGYFYIAYTHSVIPDYKYSGVYKLQSKAKLFTHVQYFWDAYKMFLTT